MITATVRIGILLPGTGESPSKALPLLCRITLRISDALPTYPENHFIYPALAACACYASGCSTNNWRGLHRGVVKGHNRPFTTLFRKDQKKFSVYQWCRRDLERAIDIYDRDVGANELAPAYAQGYRATLNGTSEYFAVPLFEGGVAFERCAVDICERSGGPKPLRKCDRVPSIPC